jgi:hypothetical protein
LPDLFGRRGLDHPLRERRGENRHSRGPILDDRLNDQEAPNVIVTHVFAHEAAPAAAGASRPLVDRKRPLSAQPRHCRAARGRSLHHPICRPSSSSRCQPWFLRLRPTLGKPPRRFGKVFAVLARRRLRTTKPFLSSLRLTSCIAHKNRILPMTFVIADRSQRQTDRSFVRR